MDDSQSAPELVTALQHDGDWVEFVVRTDNSLYQDRLIKMGWRPVASDSLSRRLANSGDVDRIFENFTLHLEEMIQQSARLRPVAWDVALAQFVDRTRDSDLQWWLYGSAALAVRGLDIVPGDLDLAVNDPWLVGALLADILVEPVTRMENWVAKSGGRAFSGALIEWLSDADPSGSALPHEQEPAASTHLEVVTWRGRAVSVPRLELQLAVAEQRNLAERCGLIRQAMTRS